MTKIILGDLHFGVKQNSVTWLNSQLDFFYKQLIPYIDKRNEDITLIQLGDVFDSRSTISTLVATKVVELFTELRKHVCRFVIIGGNHDYYSPTSDSVDSLSLLLKETGAEIYTKEMKEYEKDLYVPWYEWIEKQDIIQKKIDSGLIKNIYTHADIINEQVTLKGEFNLWSGHVHTPDMDCGRYNTGAAYALTFTDCNAERGFYVANDNKDNGKTEFKFNIFEDIEFIPNTQSISFWRLYNDDIFKDELVNKIKENDYIELYINQYNLIQEKYGKKIDWFLKKFKNCWNIPQVVQNSIDDSTETFSGYDIESICRKAVPDEVKDKFEQVLQELSKNKE